MSLSVSLGARPGGAPTRRHTLHRASARRSVRPLAVGVFPDVDQAAVSRVSSPAVTSVKTRILVLGTGWAAVSFVKQLSSGAGVDVTVVSPRNFFTYSPPVGSVEDRSIVEPIRSTLNTKGFTYLEAAALRINPDEQTVLCRAVDSEGSSVACPLHTFTLAYDILVLAVGSIPNTFNTPGVVENAMFFKEIEHALRFRREALERFERASLPGTSSEQAKELLTFCVVGAGPTGVELAAELHDMVRQDVARLFPPKLLEYVSINIIDLQDFVLSSYDRRIAEYATKQFKRQGINLYLGCGVKAVEPGMLLLSVKKTGEELRIPFGLCVWCTGIKMNPLCEQLIKDLPAGSQPNIRSLTTCASLRVKGSGGTIFAMGDACTIELNQAAPHAERILASYTASFSPTTPAAAAADAQEHHQVDRLDMVSLRSLLRVNAIEFPHLQEAADRLDAEHFEAQAGSDGRVGVAELTALLNTADRGLRTLPATAQVAKQQGEYLAALVNTLNIETLTDGELPHFVYKHKGSLAYIGSDSAVADIPGFSILKGILAGLVWKSFETVSQVSLRNQVLVFGDMLRSKVFGRDLSRV